MIKSGKLLKVIQEFEWEGCGFPTFYELLQEIDGLQRENRRLEAVIKLQDRNIEILQGGKPIRLTQFSDVEGGK